MRETGCGAEAVRMSRKDSGETKDLEDKSKKGILFQSPDAPKPQLIRDDLMQGAIRSQIHFRRKQVDNKRLTPRIRHAGNPGVGGAVFPGNSTLQVSLGSRQVKGIVMICLGRMPVLIRIRHHRVAAGMPVVAQQHIQLHIQRLHIDRLGTQENADGVSVFGPEPIAGEKGIIGATDMAAAFR